MVFYTPPIETTITRDFYDGDMIRRLNYIEQYQSDAVELLAHLIMAEAGSTYIDIETQYAVGSVVINRVYSDLFPDTLEDVIYQSGQYSTTSFMWSMTPTEQVYDVAVDLLAFGSVLPDTVLFQANFIQGSEIYTYLDGVYFCYY